jgi:hypothetical protein
MLTMEPPIPASTPRTALDEALTIRRRIAVAVMTLAVLASAFCLRLATVARAHEHAYGVAMPYRSRTSVADPSRTTQTNRLSNSESGIVFASAIPS